MTQIKSLKMNVPRTVAELSGSGWQVSYMCEALLPILRVTMRIREVSNRQLGAIEGAVLGLVRHRANSPRLISQLLGARGTSLEPVLRDLQNRGLLDVTPEGHAVLTLLGSRSLDRGAEVLETRHVALVSGLDGALLPGEAYKLEQVELAELGKNCLSRSRQIRHFVEPEARIPLGALDLGKMGNPKDWGFPQETTDILAVETTEPAFLVCFLTYAERLGERKAIFSFQGGQLEYRHPEVMDQVRLPLGFPRKDPATRLDELSRALGEAGVKVLRHSHGEAGLDPVLYLADLPSEAAKAKCNGRPFVYWLGEREKGGVTTLPVSTLPALLRPQERDLGGRCLRVYLPDRHPLLKITTVLRTLDLLLWNMLDGGWPDELSRQDIGINEAVAMAEQWGMDYEAALARRHLARVA